MKYKIIAVDVKGKTLWGVSLVFFSREEAEAVILKEKEFDLSRGINKEVRYRIQVVTGR